MTTFDRLTDLPIEIEGYELDRLEREVSSEFTRLSTVVRMRGGGEEGVGEDVTYDALDHIALQDAGPAHDLAGARTLGDLCELVEGLDLFPSPPVRDVSRLYRQWAFESSALDCGSTVGIKFRSGFSHFTNQRARLEMFSSDPGAVL